MEMNQLRYFVKVAELKNFTRAAESCNVSQPSLSQQIGKLERELGRPLFERLGRKVGLTASGEILYEHASRILAHVEEAVVQIHDAAKLGRGRVTIAAIPTIAPFLLPQILKRFSNNYPEATIEVQEWVTEQSVRKCLESEVDLVLLAQPFERQGLRVEQLLEEELYVACAKNHPLTTKDKITVKDIENESFVLLNDAHCLSENILSFCSQRSFLPTVSCQGSQLQTIQEIVSAGKGITLIPEMAKRVDRSTSRAYRSISGKKPSRKIVMAWNKNRFQSQLAKALAETVRQTVRLFDKVSK